MEDVFKGSKVILAIDTNKFHWFEVVEGFNYTGLLKVPNSSELYIVNAMVTSKNLDADSFYNYLLENEVNLNNLDDYLSKVDYTMQVIDLTDSSFMLVNRYLNVSDTTELSKQLKIGDIHQLTHLMFGLPILSTELDLSSYSLQDFYLDLEKLNNFFLSVAGFPFLTTGLVSNKISFGTSIKGYSY